jgi:hypothetical protein
VVEDYRVQLLSFLCHEDEAVYWQRAKYVGTYLMARYLKQVEMPDPPDVPFVLRTQARKWFRSRRFFNRKNTHLWYSILQGKRCADPLSKDMVFATYEKHRRAMQLEDPLGEERRDEIFGLLVPILDEIRDRIRGTIRRYCGSDEVVGDVIGGWTPSSNACFESTKLLGGQKEFVRSTFEDQMPPDYSSSESENCDDSSSACESAPTEVDIEVLSEELRDPVCGGGDADTFNRIDSVEYRYRDPPQLLRMNFFPRIVVDGILRTNVVIETFGYHDQQQVWNTMCADAQRTEWGTLSCEIYGILEPLKVRVISKGQAEPYYYAKGLQKSLHTAMRSMPCFRLIGRTLCPTDLTDLAQNPVQVGEGPLEWFSIDYSSATDCLSASLSAKILEYLLLDTGLPLDDSDPAFFGGTELRELALSVLAPHMCNYPPCGRNGIGDWRGDGEEPDWFKDKKIKEEEDYNKSPDPRFSSYATWCTKELAPVQQRNGQLMGSPLSFPILCIANLGLYLVSIKDDPRTLSEKCSGVLINGDDMAYVAPVSVWDTHVSIGNEVGLSMTPGKAYRHRQFVNLNSVCFHYSLDEIERGMNVTPWQIDFFNTGLFYGQNKVLQKDTTLDAESLTHRAPVIPVLLKGALPGRQHDVLRRYLRRWKSDLSEELQGRNLFIHTSLGGMGIPRPAGWSWRVTERQRKLATDLALRLGDCVGPGCTPSGPSIPTISPSPPSFYRREPKKEKRSLSAPLAGLCRIKNRFLEIGINGSRRQGTSSAFFYHHDKSNRTRRRLQPLKSDLQRFNSRVDHDNLYFRLNEEVDDDEEE